MSTTQTQTATDVRSQDHTAAADTGCSCEDGRIGGLSCFNCYEKGIKTARKEVPSGSTPHDPEGARPSQVAEKSLE
jgi:hypothetical protein